jgi:hypothetical protein
MSHSILDKEEQYYKILENSLDIKDFDIMSPVAHRSKSQALWYRMEDIEMGKNLINK